MRRILFLFLMLSSVAVWAEAYYWRPIDSTSLRFPSVESACSFIYERFENQNSTRFISDHHKVFVSQLVVECLGTQNYKNTGDPASPPGFNFGRVARYGDSCPNPETQTYNPQTGECDEPDRCSETEGMGTSHMYLAYTRTNPYDPWPTGPVANPDAVCRDSCRFTYKYGSSSCGTLVAEGPQALNRYCIGLYTGTGEECQGSEDPIYGGPGLGSGDGGEPGEPGNGDDPLDFPPLTNPDGGDPTDPSNNCGPGYVWAGSTCVKQLDNPAPPGGGGSSGGGGDTGGGDTGGGDTGGGDTGGGDTGGGDTGGGTPGGGGSPSQDRDNTDLVKGVACADERPVECKGDAYDCAVFWHVREQNCRSEQIWTDSAENRGKVDAEIASLLDGQGDSARWTEDDTETVEMQGFINARSRFLPAYCPAPVALNLSGGTFHFDLQPLCNFAEQIGNLIVAFAALFAALYVGRSFGGN